MYISELPPSIDKSWVDGITSHSQDTVVYITIAGHYQQELEEALDCLYMDNKRNFEIISLKRAPRFIGACLTMLPIVKREATTQTE